MTPDPRDAMRTDSAGREIPETPGFCVYHQTELGGRILNDALPEPIQRLAAGTAVRVTVEPLTPTPASAPGSGEAKPSGPAISYLLLYPVLRDAARLCGYSLALHGSLNRDMDLIAIPWTENAALPDDLITALKGATSLYFVEGWSGPHTLPAGRIGYKLTPGGAEYIDISVLSPFVSIARARAEGEAKGGREAHSLPELVTLHSVVLEARRRWSRVDNGYCSVCGAHRLHHDGPSTRGTLPALPSLCENPKCFSHELDSAAALAEGGGE